MSVDKSNELPIPPAAKCDQKSIEMLRVWAAGGQQHVSLAATLWDDPASWGIMLVDLAKHIAAAYQQLETGSSAETLTRIKAGFDAEWSKGTDDPHGHLLE